MSETIIQLEGVSFAYDPSIPVLQGVSLEIPSGEFSAVTGLNGSGKTTLAKLLNGLLRPTQGCVRLGGEDTRGKPISELARRVGYVFQNPDHQIFSSTTRQEIAYGLHNLGWDETAIAERTQAVLDAFSLSPYAERQPAALSFGLRRKISIASVYAMSPQVLILDEPTTGLDRRCTQELMDILDAYQREGNTILFITHDMRLVAERIPHCLVIYQGSILFHGSTRALFQSNDLVERAQLGLPQITALAQKMAPAGMRGDILSVPEFTRAYCSLLETKSDRSREAAA